MYQFEIIILLLCVIAVLSVIAEKVKIPYPILLVVVGLAIGLIPGLPAVSLSPDVVFLVFLPPLLFASAWSTSWHDFKAAKRPISLLATGCVLFTTTGVAVAAHYLVPGFSWPVAFLLGAIISPPDAVAATAITRNLGLPRRVIAILEGESLVNDASGLIAYRYALTAVATGGFVMWEAGLKFLIVATMGIAAGLLTGFVMLKIHRRIIRNATVDTTLSLLTPFMAYLLAERFHFSGVLAVVTAGLYLSWKSSELFTHTSRLQALSVWGIVVFVLNGLIFILIGLQLPAIIQGIGHYSIISLIFYGITISLVVMVVRIIWVFPGAYLPRWFSKKIRNEETTTDWKVVLIIGWTGMRGVVSLAAALALPVALPSGQGFPGRDMILFLTFCIILFTLIVQGISLPYLIRGLGIKSNKNDEELEEIEARKRMASAAIVHIEENFAFGILTEEVLSQVKNKYEIRFNHLNNYSNWKEDKKVDTIFDQFYQVQEELLNVERNILTGMRKDGTINEEVMRKIEYELDLEETRLRAETIQE
jgi:Na+/H+ antiporter